MISFRCEVSEKIGYGHLKRCLTLALILRERDVDTCFILNAEERDSAAFVRTEGFAVHEIPGGTSLADEIIEYPNDYRFLVTDINTIDNILRPERVTAYLHSLNRAGITTVYIDGLFDDAYRAPDAPEISAYVQPYLGADQDTPPHCRSWLAGGDYAILGPQYRELPARQIKDRAENLLITFGGADPQGLTPTVMRALAAANIDMPLRVIAGPYFSVDHMQEIEKAVSTYHGSADIVSRQTDLLPHYQWADMALGGSGTSRYEFAAAGLPSIFAAIRPQHEQICDIYSSYGIAQYLGFYAVFDSQKWVAAVSSLRDDPETRRNMARAGQGHIDGTGADRLVGALLEIFNDT
jgi:UDP-2,4-diacetamido-2,4,6-trideoxy-beta-L-altropyranose hydrolase